MGKIAVYSALGQPLRAEVELSATREELSGMKAQMASADAFRLAGLDYVTSLSGIRFAIDKRGDGQPVVRLSSDKPIIEPFVDMLLELNWATGRLVREYTFLLDPPEMAGKAAVVETPNAYRSAETARTPPEMTAAAVHDVKPRARDESRRPPARDDASREVRRGDTLQKIAVETRPEGVSLEQMLVGLYRTNRDAFDGANMNRLKAGAILALPDKSAVEAVEPVEAKKIVRAQSADWNSYRRKLAGVAAAAPGREDRGQRDVAGKLTAKVEDKAAPASEPKDLVKVSKADAAAAKRTEEEVIAREKALREANDRVSSLEKNIADLQKLVEMKNLSLATLQRQLDAKAAPVVPAKPEPVAKPPPGAPVEPKKPEPEAKPPPVIPVEPAPVVEKQAAKPADLPAEKAAEKPAEPAPEANPEPKPEAKPAEPPKPVEPPDPKLEEIVPPPAEEPDFVEDLIDNPLALAGGGGILALLAALFLLRHRKSGEKDDIPAAVRTALSARSSLGGRSTLAPHSGGSSPKSVFSSSGGQSIDTSYVPPPSDFSQAGPGTIDTDEVDPVAEADVYMAYGRDAQAEEILLEAKHKDPKRYAIHLKLLEIFANRKSLKQFEALATEFYTETGGAGSEWEKAAAMGLKLDPRNPLFGGVVQGVEPAAAAPQPVRDLEIVAREPKVAAETVVAAATVVAATAMPLAQAKVKEEITVVVPTQPVETAPLDFDLGDSTPAVPAQVEPEPDDAAIGALDFSLPDLTPPPAPAAESKPEPKFEPNPVSRPELKLEPEPAPPTDVDLDFDLHFDVKMTESTVLGESMQSPSFDMTSISLDLDDVAGTAPRMEQELGEPISADEIARFETSMAPASPESAGKSKLELAAEIDVISNEEVATKLDLANAYEEMGDLEGVRELLQEVLKEGNAAQREKAQTVLARIGT
ncbi:MAG: pilus assembly protein [Betaproteobacteria bacterium]|nr:pilus assembly protein [Betaproteobacteria bacterium]